MWLVRAASAKALLILLRLPSFHEVFPPFSCILTLCISVFMFSL